MEYEVSMNILYLGPENRRMMEFLMRSGDCVVQKEEALTEQDLVGIAYIVSYGYRHIINERIVQAFYHKAINLHISYLPWNKGADPNLWSFLEDTPKGVSIHYIDAGLDTGEIIVQRTVAYTKEDTLKTTYARLKNSMEELFCENWEKIRGNAVVARRQQRAEGTYHRRAEKSQFENLLVDGWDTKVDLLINAANRFEPMR